MMGAAQEAKSPSLGEIAPVAAFVVGLVTAWLYLSGWTYAYHYFDRFGIPLLMVDMPKENYKAGRSPGRAGDPVRFRHQPQDRQGARPHHTETMLATADEVIQ